MIFHFSARTVFVYYTSCVRRTRRAYTVHNTLTYVRHTDRVFFFFLDIFFSTRIRRTPRTAGPLNSHDFSASRFQPFTRTLYAYYYTRTRTHDLRTIHTHGAHSIVCARDIGPRVWKQQLLLLLLLFRRTLYRRTATRVRVRTYSGRVHVRRAHESNNIFYFNAYRKHTTYTDRCERRNEKNTEATSKRGATGERCR